MATVCLWLQMEASVFQIISSLSRIKGEKKERKVFKNQNERKFDYIIFDMEKC